MLLLFSVSVTALCQATEKNDQVLEYNPKADVQSRFHQNEEGLVISVVRAQRIYNNNSAWPNTVVVKLDNVEFVE